MLRFQLGERRRLLSFDGRFLAAFHRVLRPHSEVLGPVDGPNTANLVQTTRFVGKVTCPRSFEPSAMQMETSVPDSRAWHRADERPTLSIEVIRMWS